MFNFWIFSLIFIIVLVIIMVVLANKYGDEEFWGGILTMIVIVYFGIFVITSAVNYLNTYEVKSFQKGYEYELISLSDSKEVSGEYSDRGNLLFKYASAQVGEEIFYYVIVGNNEKGYLMKKFNIGKVYLFFDEENSPKYIITYETKVYRHYRNFMFGYLFKNRKDYVETEVVKEELHIPNNSVQVEYNIDLK